MLELLSVVFAAFLNFSGAHAEYVSFEEGGSHLERNVVARVLSDFHVLLRLGSLLAQVKDHTADSNVGVFNRHSPDVFILLIKD